MPNYCFNRISLNITQAELEKLKSRIISIDEFNDEYLDFNKIIERPKNTLLRGFSSNTLESFSKYYYENPDKLEQNLLDKIISDNIPKVEIRDNLTNIQEYIENKYSQEELVSYKGKKLILWYDWCIENWGTKWNSVWTNLDNDEINFSTAWSPISVELFTSFIKICREIIGEKANEIWLYYEESGCDLYGRYYIDNDGTIIHDNNYIEIST